MIRDTSDMNMCLQYLLQHNPFTDKCPESLWNIATGVTAPDNVNVDQALEIGEGIVRNMVGKKVADHSFRKKRQSNKHGYKIINQSQG